MQSGGGPQATCRASRPATQGQAEPITGRKAAYALSNPRAPLVGTHQGLTRARAEISRGLPCGEKAQCRPTAGDGAPRAPEPVKAAGTERPRARRDPKSFETRSTRHTQYVVGHPSRRGSGFFAQKSPVVQMCATAKPRESM